SQYGIIVEAVNITNFEFSQAFTQSIEAKVVAVQRALEAENRLRQIEIEARQREAQAKGEANAKIAEAEGQAQAILTVAEAQAEANKLINDSITDELVRYNLVDRLSPGISTIVLPSGQDFILGPEVLKA